MTEESFQQARKVMQTANYMRGMITTFKGKVKQWGNLEAFYLEQLRQSQADGAKKMLEKAMIRLKEWRDKFAALKFPDSDIVVKGSSLKAQCQMCGTPVKAGVDYCDGCLS